ncbi:ABC transporter transmembrane domain-containing protein [Glaesserella sp.]|uniref:ABC transporter transmembrane domain-containing protein n=1 Tax=Glaesserella sp. TaxID=2094731 RepID=UPI0035A13D0E
MLLIICLRLFLFTFFRSAGSMFRAWISLKMGYLINFQWTSSFFSHLLKLPLDFFEKRQVGDIHSRFGSLSTIQKNTSRQHCFNHYRFNYGDLLGGDDVALRWLAIWGGTRLFSNLSAFAYAYGHLFNIPPNFRRANYQNLLSCVEKLPISTKKLWRCR